MERTVIPASFSKSLPAHDGNLVRGRVLRLSSGDERARDGVTPPLFAVIVAENVERKTGPGRHERVQERVGRQVGREDLALFEFASGQVRFR